MERASVAREGDIYPPHIEEIRRALREWPGLKIVIEELIKRDRAHMKTDRERRAHEKRQQAVIHQVLFDK